MSFDMTKPIEYNDQILHNLNQNKMKGSLVVVLSISVLFTLIVNLTEYVSYGGMISKKTEQKYLRNINHYYCVKGIIIMASYRRWDSLAYISNTATDVMTPFTKYYINEVGLIPVKSELHKKVDSIFKAYKTPYE